MKIVEATSQNLDELALLFDSYRMFYRKPSDVEGAKKFLGERMNQKQSVIYLALDDSGEVLGFAQLYPLFSSTRMKPLWLLNDLYVKEEHRRKGIARLLIEHCKALAMHHGAAGLSLETESTNHIGNHLYPATGFDMDTEHNFYFWTNPND